MSMFKRNQPNDVLFLQTVRLADEKIARGRVRMLYCDVSGRVLSSVISRKVYERARDNAAVMAQQHKSFATIGLETSPGQYIPATVEVSQKDFWALEHILEHALKNGQLPDILKKYVKPIVTLRESERENFVSRYRQRRPQARQENTPRVLERLPYYQEEDMELSMPIYKAEYSYPLIVLKILSPDGYTPRNSRRLLVLDSDGDMAVITVPVTLARKMEIELPGHGGRKRANTCVLIIKRTDGYTLGYMPISQQQKKSLDTLTRYYEETGSGKEHISLVVKTIINRAKDSVSS